MANSAISAIVYGYLFAKFKSFPTYVYRSKPSHHSTFTIAEAQKVAKEIGRTQLNN